MYSKDNCPLNSAVSFKKKTDAMNEFQNFDEFHHKKTVIHVGSAIYEIWHQKALPEDQIREIAERIHQGEIDSWTEPVGNYRHDFRDFFP